MSPRALWCVRAFVGTEGDPLLPEVSHRAPQARVRRRERRQDPVAQCVQIADIAPDEVLSAPASSPLDSLRPVGSAGDIPRGRVRVSPTGDLRRRRGQESCPPTRKVSPAGR